MDIYIQTTVVIWGFVFTFLRPWKVLSVGVCLNRHNISDHNPDFQNVCVRQCIHHPESSVGKGKVHSSCVQVSWLDLFICIYLHAVKQSWQLPELTVFLDPGPILSTWLYDTAKCEKSRLQARQICFSENFIWVSLSGQTSLMTSKRQTMKAGEIHVRSMLFENTCLTLFNQSLSIHIKKTSENYLGKQIIQKRDLMSSQQSVVGTEIKSDKHCSAVFQSTEKQ